MSGKLIQPAASAQPLSQASLTDDHEEPGKRTRARAAAPSLGRGSVSAGSHPVADRLSRFTEHGGSCTVETVDVDE